MAGVWTNNLKGVQRASAIGFAELGYATIINRNGNQITTTKPTASNQPSGGFLGTYLAALYVLGTTNRAGRTYFGLVFGSGTTAPSVSDYDLVTQVTPTINNVTNGEYQYSNGVASRTVQVTVQNPNVLAMTIAEWGLIGYAGNNPSSYYGSCDTTDKAQQALLYRAVLDTPVTLQQYESATFTLTLQLTVAAES